MKSLSENISSQLKIRLESWRVAAQKAEGLQSVGETRNMK